MSSFTNAEKFFHACESMKGWSACKDYVADNASFNCQAGPLVEVTTVEAYSDWMAGFKAVAPNGSYEIHASSFDESTNTALFFATFSGTHTGDAGPVPPTNKTTNSHYVYAMQMNDEGKIANMTKIWNAAWAFKEIGWM